MSTAGKPTYFAKIGSGQLGVRRTYHQSGKDQTAHTKLKYRQTGQHSQNEIRNKDFKVDLEKKESEFVKPTDNKHQQIENNAKGAVNKPNNMLLLTDFPNPNIDVIKKYDDSDAVDNRRDFESSEDESEDDDDEDDDELELQAELERIKVERELARLKKEAEERELAERGKVDNAVKGNPLLSLEGDDSAKVKRKWNDDVVFRNQTRDEPETKKRFINDTVRNDFHRLFLKKYVH